MPTVTKYNPTPRMVGPGVEPHMRTFAKEVGEDVSFSESSISSSSVSTSSSSESSESV